MDAWPYATALYASAEVREACLALQDAHGQCVAFLLWRAWTIGEGRALDEADLATAAARAREWQGGVTGPLREVRRWFARSSGEGSEAEHRRLRDEIANLETQSERLLIEALAQASPPVARAGPIEALEGLRAAVRAFGGTAPDDLLAKLARGC